MIHLRFGIACGCLIGSYESLHLRTNAQTTPHTTKKKKKSSAVPTWLAPSRAHLLKNHVIVIPVDCNRSLHWVSPQKAQHELTVYYLFTDTMYIPVYILKFLCCVILPCNFLIFRCYYSVVTKLGYTAYPGRQTSIYMDSTPCNIFGWYTMLYPM